MSEQVTELFVKPPCLFESTPFNKEQLLTAQRDVEDPPSIVYTGLLPLMY